ncbi:MAG TPA: DUF308 domain-containing protein [Methanocorpusculum sp.]|nr:DUF308 domain-containing protein [Methanocorpusculum sp.]
MAEDVTSPTKGSVIGKGIVMILLGILLAVFSFFGTVFVDVMLAILLIVLGIAMICGISNFKKLSVLGIVFGILIVVIGVICLITPAYLAVALPYIVAAAALIWGIFSLVSGIAGKGADKAIFIITGILGIILGILIILTICNFATVLGPVFGAILTQVWLVRLGGIFLFISGIMVLIDGICMPGQKKETL